MTTPPLPPPGPPTGTIRLTIQGSELTSSLTVPTVTVNGYRVPSRYGVQDIPVYTGPTRIELKAEWTRTYGRAEHEQVVAPGEVVTLFYAVPFHVFARGALGPVKQRKPGLGQMLGLVAGITVVIMALVGAVIVAATALGR